MKKIFFVFLLFLFSSNLYAKSLNDITIKASSTHDAFYWNYKINIDNASDLNLSIKIVLLDENGEIVVGDIRELNIKKDSIELSKQKEIGFKEDLKDASLHIKIWNNSSQVSDVKEYEFKSILDK